MQMLYQSDAFVVLQFDLPEVAADASDRRPDSAPPSPGGYEIVDRFARKGIYIEGALAACFRDGVQALVQQGPDPEALDDFIAGYTVLAQQPVVVH
jgi:hypothetical protein